MENVLESTQSFQLSLSFSQGGGDRYLVISSLLTTFQFPWAVCIREQCSTGELWSEAVYTQDPTCGPRACEGCYFWLAAAWSRGLSVGEVCQLCACRAPPGQAIQNHICAPARMNQ